MKIIEINKTIDLGHLNLETGTTSKSSMSELLPKPYS